MKSKGHGNWKGMAVYGLCAALAVSLAGCGQGGTAGQEGAGAAENGADQAEPQNGADMHTDSGAQDNDAEGGSAQDGALDGIAYRVNTDINGLDESHRISDTLFGIFLEDINYAVDGGMYAELVKNRSFEYGMEARDAQKHGWESTNEAVAFSVQDGSGARRSMRIIPTMRWWKTPALPP